MPVPTVPTDWIGTLEDLVSLANDTLPRVLPTDKAGRAKDGVNARLVRHYTTEGLLDEPLKVGREARYTRRHLLQLLVLRRFMREGHGASSLQRVLSGQGDEALEALLFGTATLDVQPNPALAYLDTLRATTFGATRSPPAPDVPVPTSPASPSPRPERYTRLVVQADLELHVGPAFDPPRTPAERDRLADALLSALDALRRSRS